MCCCPGVTRRLYIDQCYGLVSLFPPGTLGMLGALPQLAPQIPLHIPLHQG
jgi:hypothetical protein